MRVDVTVVDEISEALVARVVRARARLARAAGSADLPGIAAALDELEDAYSSARRSGVVIPRPDLPKEEAQS
ncbi:MAG: hypothetical protein HOW97_06855 [Catenulispora sp.]|nr:hypothetical protein [Catenulispora sp.]